MVQTGRYNWEIRSESGAVQLQKSLGSIFQVEDFMEKWISRFNNWTYEIIPMLPKGEKKIVKSLKK
jgi:hypothetical protein